MSEVSTQTSAGPFETRVTRLFKIRYPVVQTGMGWVAGARLTAATSDAGGLGILGSATMSYEQLVASIARVRERTNAPFGVNVRPDLPDLTQRIELANAERLAVVSFAGPPTNDAVKRLHDAGMLCISTVGARRHAEKVVEMGVDAIIAQGAEGGGHTGNVPTSLLVPDVVDAVGGAIPVLAAGGMYDGRSLLAAFAWGADGIAMGTRFLLTQESRVPDAIKACYLVTNVNGTVVTSSIDGRPQRVIHTEEIDELTKSSGIVKMLRSLRSAQAFRKIGGLSTTELAKTGLTMHRDGELSWTQIVMAANAPMLTKAALVDGRSDAGVFPSGQVVGVIDALPSVKAMLDEMMREAEEAYEKLRLLRRT